MTAARAVQRVCEISEQQSWGELVVGLPPHFYAFRVSDAAFPYEPVTTFQRGDDFVFAYLVGSGFCPLKSPPDFHRQSNKSLEATASAVAFQRFCRYVAHI